MVAAKSSVRVMDTAQSSGVRLSAEVGALRYLYGDSQPFPGQFNFLSTLQGFLECAGRSARLHHEIGELEGDLAKRVRARSQLLEDLTGFCEIVTQHIRDRVEQATSPGALAPHASKIVESVMRQLAEARESLNVEAQQERARAEADIERKREEMRIYVQNFLAKEALATTTGTFSMLLGSQGVTLNSTVSLPAGIAASFELDPEKTEVWSHPRTVQDFVADMNLQIGMRKKFLRKSAAPDVSFIGDYTISAIELRENECDVDLRKKRDLSGDSLVFQMERRDGVFHARIRRSDDGEVDEIREAEPEDKAQLEALWRELVRKSEQALPFRKRMRWLKLDGKDVFENGLLVEFLDRLVEQFAPIVSEIAKRSPSKGELSLKIDRGDGRREEIYVTKERLASHLLQLPDKLFERFAVLEIFPE